MTNAAAGGDEYYPISIRRSDGKAYQNLDYRPLDPNDDKDIEQKERWEVIIAGHLGQQLMPKTDKRQFKLSDLPKGFELRCAVRKDGVRDYILYGHPAGPKALYRTPGEFALHALFLVSGAEDHSRCSCDPCSKMVESNRSRPAAGPTVCSPAPAREEPVSGPPAQAKPTQSSRPAATISVQSVPTAPAVPPAPVQGLPPPGITGLSNVFRVGELVWYKAAAWRLGVILSIAPKPGITPPYDDIKFAFTVAPLGHPLLVLQAILKEAVDMRPFLTFSVPATTIPELVSKHFAEVDWQAFVMEYSQDADPARRPVKEQMAGLEASKMAARGINDCFSTFNRISEGKTPDGRFLVRIYDAVFLGAEMIRIGDPVRVSALGGAPEVRGTLPGVMEVKQILVFTPLWDRNAPPSLQFKGNVYRITRATLPHPPTFVPANSLGPAYEEELSFRNEIERDHNANVQWGWQMTEKNAARAESAVRGRFYVTSKLLSLISPATLEAERARGVVEEAEKYLNNRTQSGSGLGGQQGGRRESRAVTVGKALSTQFVAPVGMVEE